MKFFQRDKDWVLDQRTHDHSDDANSMRQIDRIRSELACSVAEAFVIVGMYFETLPDLYVHWDSSLKYKKLFDYLQNLSNRDRKEFYVLFFDDDSPVVFRSSRIALFESEDEMKFAYELINKKLITIGSNVVLQSYLFKPDF
jgi:hypothetical protein